LTFPRKVNKCWKILKMLKNANPYLWWLLMTFLIKWCGDHFFKNKVISKTIYRDKMIICFAYYFIFKKLIRRRFVLLISLLINKNDKLIIYFAYFFINKKIISYDLFHLLLFKKNWWYIDLFAYYFIKKKW